MTLRHKAALALVGSYLMVPPTREGHDTCRRDSGPSMGKLQQTTVHDQRGQFLRPLLVNFALGVLVTILGVQGCAFSRGDLGAPLDASRVSDIKSGQTTEAQVVALLGAPDRIQEINKRPVFHYYRYAMKHGTVLVFSRVNIASDDLYVFFDQNGVVEQMVYGNRTNNLQFQFWPFGHTEGD